VGLRKIAYRFQNRDVIGRVGVNDFCLHFAGFRCDLNPLGIVNDMVCGNY